MHYLSLHLTPKKAAGILLLSALLTCYVTDVSARNGNSKTPIKPTARLISTSGSELPAQPRARLITSIKGMPRTVDNAATEPSTRTTGVAAAVIANPDEQHAFDMINAERSADGGQPLMWDAALCLLARLHSESMARKGFFSHVDQNGTDTAARAAALGIRGWQALGENIAYNQGFDDPAVYAVERWMRSDKHRGNILNAGFTHAGLGVAKSSDGRIFFTQVFMTR